MIGFETEFRKRVEAVGAFLNFLLLKFQRDTQVFVG